ncbi:hypothetical protein KUTeg_006174 [Tegillarca granosa]|uniref:Uncharacterized protein n=1 Tax=Tegillarca granosa TaxID=220873 RepID=A0ABQ9FFU0_TEGGR|nr:hypothetical protein KUTeg_006174 [Tegillarca granosa]
MSKTKVNVQLELYASAIMRVNSTTDGQMDVERKFEHLVRNELFKDRNGNSYDLLAINLKRARDTGLPPYNRWREFCGLPKALYFTTGPGGLVDHKDEDVKLLQTAYGKTEFIDLFTGGLSEKHLPGANVGPTFSCILAKQYRITKVADRYFWNRKTSYGFTGR